MQAWAIMNSEGMYGAFADVLHSVRTEEPAFERVFGRPLFDFLAGEPAQAEVFGRAMADFNRAATLAAVDSYDWTGARTVVDVGGGTGTLVRTLLRRHPELRGVLFDLPDVVAQAPGLDGRLELAGGDFFDRVPAGGDVYVLSWVLHDWDDDAALRILRNCRSAIAPGGRLLVVETILPPGDEPHFGKVLDVAMLVLTGGRERTEEEYAALLDAAGFRLERVLPTPSPLSLLEGRRV
jgi:SAM-dependent methyltransferase